MFITTLHLVIIFPLGHPGCSSLSFFPHFLMILKVLELLVRYFIESPSVDNSLMIFSWLVWSYILGRNTTEVKCWAHTEWEILIFSAFHLSSISLPLFSNYSPRPQPQMDLQSRKPKDEEWSGLQREIRIWKWIKHFACLSLHRTWHARTHREDMAPPYSTHPAICRNSGEPLYRHMA